MKLTECSKLLLLFGVILFFLSGCNSSRSVLQGYIEGKYTYVTAAFSGTLDRLLVQRGMQVKSGTILFILDQQPEAARLNEAKQKLTQAEHSLQDLQTGSRTTIIAAIEAQKAQVQANLNLATLTLHRYRNLLKVGAIDKASVDQAIANYKAELKRVGEIDANLEEAKLGGRENAIKAQQAAVDAAKAAVEQANWALEQKTQRAPVDALVFDTLFQLGEMVTTGQSVVALLAPKDIKVIFFVPERMFGKIALGERITFSCDSCKRFYQAKIDFISPEAEYTPPVIYSEKSREKLVYRVEAMLDLTTARSLHPGQPVQVIINNR